MSGHVVVQYWHSIPEAMGCYGIAGKRSLIMSHRFALDPGSIFV